MDLAPLEEALSQHLDDPRFWAVYADALAEEQPGSARARAVQKALRQGPATPGVPYEPEQIEVDWHYGHWRAARVVGTLPLRRVIEHVHARFLVHLVLRFRERLELALARPPRTLVRLDIEQSGSWPDLEELGPLRGQLREIRAPELELGALDGVPHLESLEVATLASCPDPLPNLRHLSVRRSGLELLQHLELPGLQSLTVRADVELEELEPLLASPLGQQLRQLEVSGAGLSDQLTERQDLWQHLERLTVDELYDGEDPPPPRMRVRREVPAEEPLPDSFCLRMPPPTTALAVQRAVQAAAEELGLRVDELSSRVELGMLLGQQVVFPLARALAARERTPVQVLHGLEVTEFTPEGLVRRAPLGTSPWSSGERTYLSDVPEYDLERSELEDGLYVVEEDDDRHENDYDSGSEEGWEDEPDFLGCCPTVWASADWQPDPLSHALSLPHFPRGLLPVSLSSGQPEAEPLLLGEALGAYVCWRAFAGCLLEDAAIPDLSRWTTRLLRRHRLEAEPDPHHPYWRDWRSATLQERGLRASPLHLPAYKLSQPGLWLLDVVEARLLASALRQQIPHHQPPAEHTAGLTALVALLSSGRALEVTVR